MNWVLLSLASALVSASVAVTDKIFVTRYFQDSFAYSLFLRGYDLVLAALVAWASGTMAILPFPALAWALGGGAIQVITWWMYFKAVVRADPSWVSAFSQAKPLVMVPVGLFIFGEQLSLFAYAGVAVIIAGALILSLERGVLGEQRWQLSDAVGPMLAYILASSLSSLFIRIGLENEAPSNVYFWTQMGAAGCTLILLASFPSIRSRVRAILKPHGWKVYGGCLGAEVLITISGLLSTAALASGPIGLVTALGGVRPFFVFGIVTFVNAAWSGAVPLERNRHVLPWWTAALLLVVGVYLVST